MPLHSTGPISASQIRDEFNGPVGQPFHLGEYFRTDEVVDTTPVYTLESTASTVDEGTYVTISLVTQYVAYGSSFNYTITGVNTSDINVPLTGVFTVGTSDSLTILITADENTEGSETLTLSLDNGEATVSVNINDTSLTPVSLDTATTPVVINGINSLQEITVSDYISAGRTLIIPAGWWIWSDNTTVPAINADIACTIINNGNVIGRGGDGGGAVQSINGGPAITNTSGVNVDIINNSGSYIAGGGGGGGGAGGGGAGGGNGSRAGRYDGNTPSYSPNGGSLGQSGGSGNLGPSAGGVPSGGGAGGGGGNDADPRPDWGGYHGGGGGGRILPGTGGAGGANSVGGIGGDGGSAGNPGGNGWGGGGGGWGAAGGNSGGTGGAAISGGNVTLTNNGTIYGAT